MKRKEVDLHIFLSLVSAVILLGGLLSAVLVYQTAENHSSGVLGYEQGDGSVYPINAENSKKYLRDMELYGGKANVLADELRRAFAGLWHGRSLAFTIGCLTILTSFVVFYVSNHLPTRVKSNISGEDNRDGAD